MHDNIDKIIINLGRMDNKREFEDDDGENYFGSLNCRTTIRSYGYVVNVFSSNHKHSTAGSGTLL
jgi:hypothetical protein